MGDEQDPGARILALEEENRTLRRVARTWGKRSNAANRRTSLLLIQLERLVEEGRKICGFTADEQTEYTIGLFRALNHAENALTDVQAELSPEEVDQS